ncbi:hypothetical protein ANO11243_029620 [Dothideomycetidae sp. 11243]|nr:hypothetical protein ANO11243_029620 [fungal sp. No.11243]
MALNVWHKMKQGEIGWPEKGRWFLPGISATGGFRNWTGVVALGRGRKCGVKRISTRRMSRIDKHTSPRTQPMPMTAAGIPPHRLLRGASRVNEQRVGGSERDIISFRDQAQRRRKRDSDGALIDNQAAGYSPTTVSESCWGNASNGQLDTQEGFEAESLPIALACVLSRGRSASGAEPPDYARLHE